MLTGNKGEWSELYAFIRLLERGRLYAADEETNRVENVYFPILSIIREELEGRRKDYVIHTESGTVQIWETGNCLDLVRIDELAEYANLLLRKIKAGGDRAFSIDESDEIMDELYCEKISAPASDKTDITIKLHDINTGYDTTHGFSIKSELGSAPTLLNASKSTNFVYKVNNISNTQMETINSLNSRSKIIDRISAINREGSIAFVGAKNSVFAENLMLIDSCMESIIGELLLYYYRDNISTCEDLIDKIEEENPLNYPRRGFYKFKFKKFLCSVALGMQPAHEWDGYDEANGGYIIVKEDGDVVAYHIYNRDSFEEYLLKNTKLEKASTTRHDYASIYEDDGKKYINLNLQIRFK